MRSVIELGNRNIIVRENTYQSDFKLENESAYAIMFVFSGLKRCRFSNKKITIFPDSFSVINPGTNYESIVDSFIPVDTLTLYLDKLFVADFYQMFVKKYQNLPLEAVAQDAPLYLETLYPFMGDMRYNISHLRNQIDKGVENEMLINEYLHHYLLNYHQLYAKEVVHKMESLTSVKTKTRQEILRRLFLAKEYINSNFNKNVTLENVSKNCFLSINHLLRTFKEAFGISPYQYLMQLRINRAKYLLETTDYPVNDVISLIGFENTSSFIRLFKQSAGITPNKYRKLRT